MGVLLLYDRSWISSRSDTDNVRHEASCFQVIFGHGTEILQVRRRVQNDTVALSICSRYRAYGVVAGMATEGDVGVAGVTAGAEASMGGVMASGASKSL